MAGILYKWYNIAGIIDVIGRGIHLYKISQYWHGNGDNDRYGIGLIKYGNDYLLPSLDYNRDICCYIRGADTIYTSNAACPNFTIMANGQPNCRLCAVYAGDAIGYNGSTADGYWVGTTLRTTEKLRGSIYNTVDSQVHHDAGRAGIMTASMVDYSSYDASDRYHAALYYHDFNYNFYSNYIQLAAVRNMVPNHLAIRHANFAPQRINDMTAGAIFNFFDNGQFSHRNYYYNYDDNNPYAMGTNNVYWLQYRWVEDKDGNRMTVTINSNSYDLIVIIFDPPVANYNARYFEVPYVQYNRVDSTTVGSVFILDECITIHRNDL